MPKKNVKNAKNKSSNITTKRTMLYKDDMQEYCQMTKMLGDRRIMVQMIDKTEVMAIIPGRFRKRCWIKVGDVLIVSRRSFQEDKYDVIYKYNEDEIKILIDNHDIPSFFISLEVPESDNIDFSTTNKIVEDDDINEIDFDDI